MSIHKNIRYIFNFSNRNTKEFLLTFDEETLDLLPGENCIPQSWAELSLHQCNGCQLDATIHKYCPAAVQVGRILDEFKGIGSFEVTTIEATDDTRSYTKVTSVQEGLGSLIGIIMPTCGCPLLKPLRPMVRFHLPFVSFEELEYRMVSMYLFAQYLRQQNGKQPDWALEKLQDIYKKISAVNLAFAKRMPTVTNGDAGINAIVILDCFAQSVPKAILKMMKEFNPIFAPLLD